MNLPTAPSKPISEYAAKIREERRRYEATVVKVLQMYPRLRTFTETYWWGGIQDTPEYHQIFENRLRFLEEFKPKKCKFSWTKDMWQDRLGIIDHKETYLIDSTRRIYVALTSPYKGKKEVLESAGFTLYHQLYNNRADTGIKVGTCQELKAWCEAQRLLRL
jgi:hypothetical protein